MMNGNKIIAAGTNVLVAYFVCGFAATVQAGNITGRVVLNGTPPTEVVIDASADAVCARLHVGRTFTTRHYLVGSNGGLADTFFYIKSSFGAKTLPHSRIMPVLDQKSCFYVPYVMGVQVGQPFKIRNSDPTLHNVHAMPRTNAGFNIAQPVQGMVTQRVFDESEVFIRFKCDVHPWMFAYVGVVDNPFFAVTGKDGTFRISGVPPGKYTLAAVHPKLGEQTQEVMVADQNNTPVDFTFKVKPPR